MKRPCFNCLRRRAEQLAPEAAANTEVTLIGIAKRMEMRHQHSGCGHLAVHIALQYLLLAGHPEVAGQFGLADQYNERAREWFGKTNAHPAPAVAQPAVSIVH